ncbi:MAG: 50S ribosomal protein L2 [Alphaproteobacteria bacterium]|nr:50S ribosomal protein L2 [Alphaproteobacteria bacterium]
MAIDRAELWKGKPIKALTDGLKSSGGRNNMGRVTSRGMGGGHARRYRLVDFKRQKTEMPATVERIEYDPNRTAFIALIKYQDGTLSYILAPQKLQKGDTVQSGEKVDIKAGNALPLKNIPVGTVVHNVEMRPGKGGQLARAAGASVQLVGRDSGFVQIRMNSGELRMVPEDCFATIGAVSNQDLINTQTGKAGRTRWRGVRPITRGIARNPVDHPNGGRTNGGKHWRSPWGMPTKGYKTRTNKRTNKFIIRRAVTRKDAQGARA